MYIESIFNPCPAGIQNDKNSGEKSIPRDQPNQNKEWKLQTQFYWVCSLEIMKSATSLMPPSTNLCGKPLLQVYIHAAWPDSACTVGWPTLSSHLDISKNDNG